MLWRVFRSRHRRLLWTGTALSALGLPVAAQAPDPARAAAPKLFFVEAGATRHDGTVAGLGLRQPWRWQAQRWDGRLSLAADLSLHHWSAPTAQGRQTTTQLAWVPMLRWQADEGLSPWFAEAGIGLSLHDRPYQRDGARMSTRWNFQEVLAVGRRVGERQEFSLRLQHLSNAGLNKPNPGEEALMFRWALSL
jgi:lipid A 3-O-deacylase